MSERCGSGRVRVLIVEDDFAFRRVTADGLAEQGWEIRSAATGADALAVLRTWRPDVILLDLILPLMDGWSFRAEAERQRVLDEVPIVVTSAAADLHREAERLRAAATLAKPFGLDDLVHTVQKVISTTAL